MAMRKQIIYCYLVNINIKNKYNTIIHIYNIVINSLYTILYMYNKSIFYVLYM